MYSYIPQVQQWGITFVIVVAKINTGDANLDPLMLILTALDFKLMNTNHEWFLFSLNQTCRLAIIFASALYVSIDSSATF